MEIDLDRFAIESRVVRLLEFIGHAEPCCSLAMAIGTTTHAVVIVGKKLVHDGKAEFGESGGQRTLKLLKPTKANYDRSKLDPRS